MSSIAQIRGARGLLGWSQTQLAVAAGLSEPTVKRYETGRGANVSAAALAKMVAALEVAGVIFVEENGEGPGVRLKKARPAIGDEAALPEIPKGEPYDGSAM
jgi:transcriptional regulator with XRE-family HTH domain